MNRRSSDNEYDRVIRTGMLIDIPFLDGGLERGVRQLTIVIGRTGALGDWTAF